MSKNILTDAEVMDAAEDFLAVRDSLFPSIRGRDELCMFAERIGRLAQEVARERATLEKIHATLECDGHGFWLPEWCVKECSTVDGSPPTFNEFCENIRAREVKS